VYASWQPYLVEGQNGILPLMSKMVYTSSALLVIVTESSYQS